MAFDGWKSTNFVTVYRMLPVQCRMARAALRLGVRELAAAAKTSPDTVARLERGESLKPQTVSAIRAVLELSGVEFIPAGTPSPDGGSGIRMKEDAA